MPTEDIASRLAELVKTTESKVLLTNQTHNLLNDLSKVAPPSTQDIQNNYPFLFKILLECFPETSKKLDQKDLTQLLSSLSALEKVTFTVPKTAITDTLIYQLSAWISENIGAKLLIDCTSSTEIVGGVLVSHAGHFLDLSLDKVLKGKVYA